MFHVAVPPFEVAASPAAAAPLALVNAAPPFQLWVGCQPAQAPLEAIDVAAVDVGEVELQLPSFAAADAAGVMALQSPPFAAAVAAGEVELPIAMALHVAPRVMHSSNTVYQVRLV